MTMINLFAVVDAQSRESFEKLTLHRTPSALPFAGKFRLIDFTLSNLLNSGVTTVALFPSGNYRSLQDHVGSGKRWNLDRRRDGLFVLPPKNLVMPQGEMLTFQRMHEHIEYFKRSTQKYVLLTTAQIVWNIDFEAALQEHIDSQADISEIMSETRRLRTFITQKELLLRYIRDYDVIPYKTMNDLVWREPKLKVNTIVHQAYTKLIRNPSAFLRANLDMLKFEIGQTIFKPDRPIISKEKTAPPARYLKNARLSNVMVAAGAQLSGDISDSVIGRDVTIKEHAVVRRSVLMNNAFVEAGAQLDHVILDKNTVVKQDAVLQGTLQSPYVTEKNQIITDQSGLSILLVAAEAYPYAKTGGLADVVDGLSKALSKQGVETSVILPLYKQVKEKHAETFGYLDTLTFTFAGETRKIRLYNILREKVRFYFIEHFGFFERDALYGYEDDCTRFAFFNFAVREVLGSIGPFDLLHLHDWHTGLLPALLEGEEHPPTLLTIHNIDYQGICTPDTLAEAYAQDPGKPVVNFLEEGIQNATKLSTVSETYRDELRYEYYGKNLTQPLLKRERDFHGVLNGLSKQHSPSNDPLILAPYHPGDLSPKTENKLYLQRLMRLPLGVDRFIVGMVSRITEQKGFPILIDAMSDFLERHDDAQFVLLGTGEQEHIDALKGLKESHPRQVRLNIGYDSAQPNHIYAGSDCYLMPSRVEPCGLSQMIAMRYGTLPLVRLTGGLADSVEDYDPITKEGTGFTFFNYDSADLLARLEDAYRVFKERREDWERMQRRAMRRDFSLEKQAQKMLEIYQSMV